MNQVFSFTRWWMLVTRHWMENRKRYMLALLAIAGLMVAWYGFVMMMNGDRTLALIFQFMAYYVGLYFVGCLYASTMFGELSSKPQGVSYLTVPASQLEKLCCVLFFGVVLFFIAYTLIFYIVDIPMVQLSRRLIAQRHLGWDELTSPEHSVYVYNIFTGIGGPIPDRDWHLFLVSYFSIQSAFILGSVYFTRYAFLKTIVAILLFMLVAVCFITKVIRDHLPAGWRFGGNMLEWIQLDAMGAQEKLVRLPNSISLFLIWLTICGIPLLFWVITYVRLKEKEV
jgi:hypothetical protein